MDANSPNNLNWQDPWFSHGNQWSAFRPFFSDSCGHRIHEDNTFGHLTLDQTGPETFETTYESWKISIHPGAGAAQSQTLPTKDADTIPSFYAFERIALPMMRILRGCVLLHASCIANTRHCVALLAQTGVGKTTLAGAMLQDDSFQLVAEDIAAVPLVHDRPEVLPSATYLAMRHDALDGLQFVDHIDNGSPKHYLHLKHSQVATRPCALSAIVVLSKGTPQIPERSAHAPLLPALLRQQMSLSAAPQAFKSAQFQDFMQLVRQTPVYTMKILLDSPKNMTLSTQMMRTFIEEMI